MSRSKMFLSMYQIAQIASKQSVDAQPNKSATSHNCTCRARRILAGSDEARSDELECFVRSSQACQNHHSTTVCSNHLCTKPPVQQKPSQSSTMPILSTVHAMLAMSSQAQMRLAAGVSIINSGGKKKTKFQKALLRIQQCHQCS